MYNVPKIDDLPQTQTFHLAGYKCTRCSGLLSQQTDEGKPRIQWFLLIRLHLTFKLSDHIIE